MQFECLHCGESNKSLYRYYGQDSIRLENCKKCGKHIDKYIEYSIVLITLDIILLEGQAYVHIMKNVSKKQITSLLYMLTITQTIGHSMKFECINDTWPYFISYDTYPFGFNLILALVEQIGRINVFYFHYLVISKILKINKINFFQMICVCTISSYGNFFKLIPLLWKSNECQIAYYYEYSCNIIILCSRVCAIRGISFLNVVTIWKGFVLHFQIQHPYLYNMLHNICLCVCSI
ncbi:hypothetical protein A3Q56_05612 [Intoshia linei]|uniref:Protein ARV n=1 Tax=Intoshia linei TaxID=1819745 RepID=A0A177AXF7_9BILA|nr:hypothetical protein A3Q56_05612 [Intoshia linei]